MNVDQPNEAIKRWGGILDDEPAPAVNRAIEADLARFEEYKDALLIHLSKLSKSDAFDDQKCWRRLTRLAQAYFLWQATTSATECKKRLHKLAKTLDRARSLAGEARQDNVGRELISNLFDGTLPRDPPGKIVLDDDGSLRVVYFSEIDFKQMAESLAVYRAAVLRAVHDVPGQRRGTKPSLPQGFILALGDVYRESTGRKPGAGWGPFARFVMQFRAATDPYYLFTQGQVDLSLKDAITDALRKPRAPAPFGGTQAKDRRSTK